MWKSEVFFHSSKAPCVWVCIPNPSNAIILGLLGGLGVLYYLLFLIITLLAQQIQQERKTTFKTLTIKKETDVLISFFTHLSVNSLLRYEVIKQQMNQQIKEFIHHPCAGNRERDRFF
jgi:hypothetical protein